MKHVRLSLPEDTFQVLFQQSVEKGYATLSLYLTDLLSVPKESTTADNMVVTALNAALGMEHLHVFKYPELFAPSFWESVDYGSQILSSRLFRRKVELGLEGVHLLDSGPLNVQTYVRVRET